MATVTGFTAERMLVIENTTIVSGYVNTVGHLILVTRSGLEIDGGSVIGPAGQPGVSLDDLDVYAQELQVHIDASENAAKEYADNQDAIINDTIASEVAALNTAIEAVQTSADGKNTIYWSATEPAGGEYVVNDIWYDTDNDNKMSRWDGAAWAPEEFGVSALDPQIGTDIDNAKADAQSALDQVGTLNTVTLPALQSDLDAAEADISTLNTTTIPGLQSELDSSQVDISNNASAISTAQGQINTLNVTTIPGLQSELDTLQTDLSNANAEIDAILPITETKISDNAVTTPKIISGAIVTSHMTANSINGDRITANTLNADKIVAGSITTDRMTANSINGDRITANTLNADKIVAGSITTDRMTANSINGDRITTNTLDAVKIIAGSITTDRMTANSINGDRITTNTLHADKITAATITAAKMVAGTITAASGILANASVGSAQIIDASIGNAEIADLAVTNAKIADATIQSAKIVALDASKITTGFLDSARIAAKSISTAQLMIGSTENMLNDPTFEKDLGTAWNPASGISISPNGARDGGRSFTVANSASQQPSYNLPFEMPCSEGDVFHLSSWIKQTSAIPVGGFTIGLRWLLSNGTNAWSAVDCPEVAPNAWYRVRGLSTPAPSGTVSVSLYIASQAINSTGTLSVDYVSMVKASTGELIVDGAITATKISTGAVTAGKISAGAIDGMTITGALLQTTSTANRGIKIVSVDNGAYGSMIAYDSAGNPTFTLNGQTGDITLKGTLTSGSTVTGATITGGTIQTATTSERIVITSSPSPLFEFHTEASTQAPAATWKPSTWTTDYVKIINGSGPNYYHALYTSIKPPVLSGSAQDTATPINGIHFLSTHERLSDGSAPAPGALNQTDIYLRADVIQPEANSFYVKRKGGANTYPTIQTDSAGTVLREPGNDNCYLSLQGGMVTMKGMNVSYVRAHNTAAVLDSGANGYYIASQSNAQNVINGSVWVQNGSFNQTWGGLNGFVAAALSATVSSGPTLGINTSNNICFRISSGLKYKMDVRSLEDYLNEPGDVTPMVGMEKTAASSAAAFIGLMDEIPLDEPTRKELRTPVLEMMPIIYKDRLQVEGHMDDDPNWSDFPRDYIGWCADDFAAGGWEELIGRDEYGDPENLYYDRVLPVVVLELKEIIKELKDRITVLENGVVT